MLYSALPGASRHHWGTDLDIYDAAAIDESYQVQLSTEEYSANGPFARLVAWLDEHAHRYGFFMPYQAYQGGVAAEPWHISYQPVSSQYLAKINVQIIRQCLLKHPVAEQTLVLDKDKLGSPQTVELPIDPRYFTDYNRLRFQSSGL